MTQQAAPAAGADGPSNDGRAVEAVQDTMSQFLSAASVDAVYGEPIHEAGTTVIPCAEVLSMVGFGIGYGSGSGSGSEGNPGGGGGGGGGRVLSRPVAIIEITPNGVNVKPVIDVTKLGLAGITAWGFMISMAMRMMRHRRK